MLARMKIISGGTRGADTGALRAAKLLGLTTGGVAHHGDAGEYGMSVEPGWTYAKRDRANVDAADAVVGLLSGAPGTGRGTRATLAYAAGRRGDVVIEPGGAPHTLLSSEHKPVLVLHGISGGLVKPHAEALADFLANTTPSTLCVSGNGEKTTPGAEAHMQQVLLAAMRQPTGRTRGTGPGPYEFYLVIDFEASGHVKDSKQWEIVEFPCCVLDASTGAVVAEFHEYVKPTANPALSQFCIDSCGITQETVSGASPIAAVMQRFLKWIDRLPVLSGASYAALTCGNYDLNTALPSEQVNKHLPELPLYLKRWVNVKEVFAAETELNPKGRLLGMAGMLRALGLPLVGRHHSGIDDARNIAAVAAALLARGVRLPVTGSRSGVAIDPPKATPVATTRQEAPVTRSNPKPKPKYKSKSRLQA